MIINVLDSFPRLIGMINDFNLSFLLFVKENVILIIVTLESPDKNLAVLSYIFLVKLQDLNMGSSLNDG